MRINNFADAIIHSAIVYQLNFSKRVLWYLCLFLNIFLDNVINHLSVAQNKLQLEESSITKFSTEVAYTLC